MFENLIVLATKNFFLGLFLYVFMVVVLSKLYEKFIQKKIYKKFVYEYDKNKQFSLDIIVVGLLSLGVTLIFDLIFRQHILAWYVGSSILLAFGILILWPKKFKLDTDCYIAGGSLTDITIEYKGRKIKIASERWKGEFDTVFYYDSKHRSFLPPYENQSISEEDYQFIIDALVKHFTKLGEKVNVQK